MNSDAKIGLLLGLVFIVIISFIINGLPNLFKGDDQSELAVAALIDVPDYTGISDPAEEAVQTIRLMDNVVAPRQVLPPSDKNEAIRFEQEFNPGRNSVVAEDLTERRQTFSKKTTERIYEVKAGDNLAVIAKKFYGDEHGNRHIVIEKLYAFNRKTLKSADQLMVGDKLKIPPLALLYGRGQENIESSGLFERVKTVAGDGVAALKTAVGLEKPTEYIVKSGDTLWKIAETNLGDGSRYEEIVNLNSRISDCDELETGMILNLPGN